MSLYLDDAGNPGAPLRGTLSSFGSQADGKAVKGSNFTLQGNSGSGWATITSDKYQVRRKMGEVQLRPQDSSDNDLDWDAYMNYQALGNAAFRATYTVKEQGGTSNTYTTETVTMAEVDPYFPFDESGGFDGELPSNLWVDELHAIFGDVGGWEISANEITSDSGNVVISSSPAQIRMGNATAPDEGRGVFLGKDSGEFHFRIGDDPDDSNAEYMWWDGDTLIHTGHQTGGTIAGSTNGWKVKAGYMLSKNEKVRIDANDQYFAAGDTVPTSYGNNAGIWVGYDGSVAKMSLYTDSNNYLQYNGSVLTWKAANTTLDSSGNLTASNVTLSGAITATSGAIGGFDIGSDYVRDAANSFGLASTVTGGDDVRFWAGAAFASRASAPLRITEAGALVATSATITGAVTATSGAIGGFSIGSDYVRDVADTFGLASTVTGGDDVRFWAGAAFASRASAPLQIYESGFIFAKDIVLAKGNLSGASGATGYGYAVGDPLLLLHFDGAKPFETDYYGSLIGHKGQAGTYTWGGTQGRGAFRLGKFNKGVQIAEATTNLITNPSFETNVTSWSSHNSPTFANRTNSDSFFGQYSYRLTSDSTGDGFKISVTVSSSTSYTLSAWAKIVTGSFKFEVSGNVSGTIFTNVDLGTAGSGWKPKSRTFTTGASDTSITIYILATTAASDGYFDGFQLEQKSYATPYCDGSLGDGHTWSGTTHASTSARTAAILTYPASGNINLVQGTFICWYYLHAGGNASFPALLDARIDTNNRITVHASQTSGTYTPYVDTVSGGSTVSTSTGASTVTEGWHMVVVTWTTGSLKCYVDGSQSGATGSYVIPSGTLTSIEVGSRAGGSASLNSRIDEFAILPVVLTLNEIKSLYYSSAPMMIGVTNQEFRLSGAGLGEVFGNAYGLFARDAVGNPAFGLLNAAINVNTWGGDSETLGVGDFLFGSNKSNKPNLFYDASDGELEFRVAKTRFLFINSTGLNFVGGSGAVNTIKFLDSADTLFEIQGYLDTPTTVANIVVAGKNSSNREAILNLTATTDDGAAHAGVGSVSIRLDTELDGGGIFMANKTYHQAQVYMQDTLVMDANNIATDTTTGTKIATQPTQKLGFWGKTPVAQQVLATGTGKTVDNVISMLQTIGICKQS